MYVYREFDGVKYKFDFFCFIDNGTVTYSIESPYYKIVDDAKVYYRHPKKWTDTIGHNAGYYVIANLNGHRHRVYF